MIAFHTKIIKLSKNFTIQISVSLYLLLVIHSPIYSLNNRWNRLRCYNLGLSGPKSPRSRRQ